MDKIKYLPKRSKEIILLALLVFHEVIIFMKSAFCAPLASNKAVVQFVTSFFLSLLGLQMQIYNHWISLKPFFNSQDVPLKIRRVVSKVCNHNHICM